MVDFKKLGKKIDEAKENGTSLNLDLSEQLAAYFIVISKNIKGISGEESIRITKEKAEKIGVILTTPYEIMFFSSYITAKAINNSFAKSLYKL